MDCKNKILIVAAFPPPVHGSALMSQYIKDSKLVNSKFECDYVNLSTSRRMDEIGKRNSIKIFRFLGAFCNLLLKLILHRYSLCYLAITCHGLGFLKDAPFVLLCKLFRRRVVIHQHNKGMANDVNKSIYRWLLPLVYRNTSVVLLSWYLYDDISSVVKKEQVYICPNGIPESIKNRVNIQKDNEIPHILFLSNLLLEKGVLVLLDALKLLKDRGYSFICDFVGSETKDLNSEAFEQEVKKRGLDTVVIYNGCKYGRDKSAFFEQADVFVFPTFYHNECFPLVLLEAMEHSIPCISTIEGGIRDIIDDKVSGYVIPCKDFVALERAIEKLILDSGLRKEMGAKGRNKFEKEFSLEIFEKNMCEIFDKCLQM